MLNKLRCINVLSDEDIRLHRKGISPDQVLSCINWRSIAVERVEHGTLSASFLVHSEKKAAFLKTHLFPEGRVSLEREFHLLDTIYSETLPSAFQKLYESNASRLWVMMPLFEKNQTPFCPKKIIQLLNNLDLKRIHESRLGLIHSQLEGIETLIELSKIAHENLLRRNLLDNELRVEIIAALNFLDREVSGLQPTLCHGDLSPVNIMQNKNEPILIDWEDAFIGVTDYDYLYWLTFFENRKWYQLSPLQYTSNDRRVAKALLLMIVLLKCELAWRRNIWRLHSLSFNDRIREIMNLI